jgi:protein-S-isoprenylcysteine O-methyltransferase Ste14
LGWLLLPISIVLLSYSLTIGISLGKNYSRSGVSNHLVKTGNYALIRHPDLIWYVTFLIALILVSSSATLLIVAPIWAAWKLICVIIQDKVLFVRMIPGYRQYKQETPMIIPNRKSLIAFWRTIKIDIHRSEKIVV